MLRYHLRVLWIYLRWRLAGKPRALESRLTFRASAWDCDWYRHINNGRYLEYFDCGRTDLLLRSGLAAEARQNEWLPVVGSVRVRYRREVKWNSRFTVVTRLDRVAGKALVFSSLIYVGDELTTENETDVLVIKRGKVIEPDFATRFVKPG